MFEAPKREKAAMLTLEFQRLHGGLAKDRNTAVDPPGDTPSASADGRFGLWSIGHHCPHPCRMTQFAALLK
jgi:hypothetical protein